MADDTGDAGLTAGADLTVETLHQVKATREKLPTPAFVTEAVAPEVGTSKWRNGVRSVAHEATHGVRVQAQHERNEQVVGVPEGLERLLPNAVVRGRVHEKHAEEHNMASDSTRLSVVDFQSAHRTDLGLLDIEEAASVRATLFSNDATCLILGEGAYCVLLDVVAGSVHNGEEKHGIGELAMEPEVLVEGQETKLRPDNTDERPADRAENKRAIDRQDETGTSGNPHGEFERVETD
jgi:hypothetical protein